MRQLYDYLQANANAFVEIPSGLRGTTRDVFQRMEELRNFYGCDIQLKRRFHKPALYKLIKC